MCGVCVECRYREGMVGQGAGRSMPFACRRHRPPLKTYTHTPSTAHDGGAPAGDSEAVVPLVVLRQVEHRAA